MFTKLATRVVRLKSSMRWEVLLRAVFCGILCFAAAANCQDGPGPMVDTSSGRIVGLYTDQAKVFRSVPYARPPIGELRWKDPERVLPVPGILQTTEDPPGCPQVMPCDLPLSQFICPLRISEDCLYLNIFTPRNAQPTSNLPVMVFIHGGNFIRGYCGGLLYDAQYIANTTSTVVVAINYRLGAMGFLVYEGALTGNYGLRDQRMALEWVQENIPQFGGNPREVTLWGQSAGAISASVHMASIRSSGLFSKAIIESNPFGLTLKNLEKARELGKDLARELGCRTVECLHQKNITEIANAQESIHIVDFRHLLEIFLQWTPVVDNVDLFDQPIYLLSKGQVEPIPFIVGTTSEESIYFIYQAFTSPVSALERDVVQGVIIPRGYEKLQKLYPPSKGDNRPGLAAMGTDVSFTCTTRYAVWGAANYTAMQEAHNTMWLYVFNHSISFDPWGKEFDYCNGHSCHAIELPFVFHTLNMANFTPTAAEMELATNMTRYWTNFARTGNPNDGFHSGSSHTLYKSRGVQKLPDWPQYYADVKTGTKNAGCMRFKTPSSEVINDYRGDVCSVWDSIGYYV